MDNGPEPSPRKASRKSESQNDPTELAPETAAQLRRGEAERRYSPDERGNGPVLWCNGKRRFARIGLMDVRSAFLGRRP
jgi:hypothetical protein